MTFARFLRAPALAAALLLPGLASALDIQKVTSPAGIDIWFVEDQSVPIVSMDAAFLGGATLDGAEKAGLARFTTALLDEGAGDLESQAFQRRVEALALRLGFDVDRQAMTLSASTLLDVAEDSFDLIGLALTQPRFDESAVERVRRQLLFGLQAAETDPETIAAQALRQARYGDHPLGRPVRGTVETVEAITRDDLAAFAEGQLAKDRLLVAIVGAVDAETAGALVDRAFGALPAEGDGGWEMPPVQPLGQGEVIINAVDAPQSIGYFAQPGMRRNDPDWYAAILVNRVLGSGGFASRLVEEVREKRGLAYSVYAALVDFPAGPMIFGSVATANERFAESWDVIQTEWRRMAEEGPTEQELRDAKANVIGSFPLRMTSTGRIASVLLNMRRDELPIDHLDRRAALIDAVTLEDARRVAARLYDADALTLSVAGQPDGLGG